MDIYEESLLMHEKHVGKIEVTSKVKLEDRHDLSLAYTPGVAQPCLEIQKDKALAYKYTSKGNIVAVITDGTAVLGLGDIGPEAAMPVMEGKAVLFKEFAGVDAFPICVNSKDPKEFIQAVKLIAPSFGGINLEDISAPRCYEIEETLKAELDIPVFHDDQHGTAVVVLAALTNALKIVKKSIDAINIVVTGIGAAGSAIVRMLLAMGAKNITLCGRYGIIYPGDAHNDAMKEKLAQIVNPQGKKGSIADAFVGADVFIGVSSAGIINKDMVASMNKDAVIFALANPVPEISRDEALAAGARIVGTGRSDFPNQINNVLAFPGLFKGALSVRAREINQEMKLAAIKAIADYISEDKLNEDYIIPNCLDRGVAKDVIEAVAAAAAKSGVART